MPAPEPLSPEKPKPPPKPRKPAAPKIRKTVAATEPDATDRPRKPTVAQLRKKIVAAYAAAAGSATSVRVRLNDLRAGLPDIDRETLDKALVGLHEAAKTKISLMPLEDPRQMTPAVRDAAVVFKGEAMHLIWVDP